MAETSTPNKHKKKKRKRFINRELSWLAFNDRVLQEAADPTVPLIERLRFLGIYSNNQDEFFRVRVATKRRVARLGKSELRGLDSPPKKVLKKIQEIVVAQQAKFDNLYLELLAELKNAGIVVLNEEELDEQQGEFVRQYFVESVRHQLFPLMLDKVKSFPTLRDTSIYLAIRLLHADGTPRYALAEIPVSLPRFIELPPRGEARCLILLDDVIRFNLANIFYMFEFSSAEAYTIKFTRDAELDLDNDVSISLMAAVERSLKRRRVAEPLRLTYDAAMPPAFLAYLTNKMNLSQEDALIPGARYHNFKDFMGFPHLGRKDLLYPPLEPLPHPAFANQRSVFETLRKQDVALYVPYQSFTHILDCLREAAIDPKVTEIHMTLYRVAENSAIVRALINAARNSIAVTVVVEPQARFDEEANIAWGKRMQEEGVRVIFGVPNLKVHAKLALITTQIGRRREAYAIIGTGNYNENTARFYSDVYLMTSETAIAREVRRVFAFFDNMYEPGKYRHLLLAPFYLRKRLNALINREIRHARAGKRAGLTFKLNNLVDRKIIKKLYEASRAGVEIKLMVRGICSLIPGLAKTSENIEVVSVVDRFLEHARIFSFVNAGHPQVFIGSADLMTRNLDFRVEALVELRDPTVRRQILDTLRICWRDNVKARQIDGTRKNPYRKRRPRAAEVRSQYALYDYYRKLSSP